MKRKRGTPLHGWVILDKPEGLSSTQAMAKVRGILNAQKAGHGGTLDPFATGVLPIALGEATKLLSHVLDGNKVYQFRVVWGEARDTDDVTGKTIATSPRRPSRDEIENILPRFLGPIQQTPPQFSAIHVDGERAYERARAGEVVDIKARPVHIHRLTCLGMPSPDEAVFEVACGKGTYVRSLARDVGEALGTKAYVKTLKRLVSGPFHIDQAISLEKLQEIMQKDACLDNLQTCVLSLDAVLDDIPAVAINEQETRRLRQGQAIMLHPSRIPAERGADNILAARGAQGLVALGKLDMNALQPVRVFNNYSKGETDVA